LESGDGVTIATRTIKILRFAGLILCMAVVFGVIYGLPSISIAIAAAAFGWVIAETNALQDRMAQWPELKQYID